MSEIYDVLEINLTTTKPTKTVEEWDERFDETQEIRETIEAFLRNLQLPDGWTAELQF